VIDRRGWIAALAGAALLCTAGRALAAPPLVEIVAMAHPPVKAALAPLREWLAAQGKRITLREIDAESADGTKRLQAAGLSGHVPVLILIDGQYRIRRKDGVMVELVNFPNQPDTPAGARGAWAVTEVQAVLAERIK